MIMIMATGNALTRVMVCNAFSPPATSSVAATRPAAQAQNNRCHAGVCRTPPEARESITRAPESAEVTKKVTINSTVINETIDVDRKSTRLNSSHVAISYAVFCLKKKKRKSEQRERRYQHEDSG